MEKILRRWLWKDRDGHGVYLVLVVRVDVCGPLSVNSLGVPNIKLFNKYLITKWWWRLITSREAEVFAFVSDVYSLLTCFLFTLLISCLKIFINYLIVIITNL